MSVTIRVLVGLAHPTLPSHSCSSPHFIGRLIDMQQRTQRVVESGSRQLPLTSCDHDFRKY